MRLCRVVGPVVSSAKHPAYRGHKLLSVRPVDEAGRDSGRSFLAVDTVQAGENDRVLVLTEGSGVLGTGDHGAHDPTEPHDALPAGR